MGGISRTFRISGPFGGRSRKPPTSASRFRLLTTRRTTCSSCASRSSSRRSATISARRSSSCSATAPPRRPSSREARPAEGHRRPPREGAREGRPRPGRADAAGARDDGEALRPHRSPLPLQEHRHRRRGRLERRSGLPPPRRRGDAPDRQRLPDDLRRRTRAPQRGRRAPARAPAGEARRRLPRRRRRRGRRVRPRCRVLPPQSMRRLRRPSGGLWANPDFVKLWSGQSISEFGSQISALAIPLLAATQLHASPLAFSLLGVLGFLPFILFALPAGVWVDRLRRRPILIVGDAGRAVLLTLDPRALGDPHPPHVAPARPAVRDRDLHRVLRRRVPVVPPVARRARRARRGQLEAPDHGLRRTDDRAGARRRARRGAHRARTRSRSTRSASSSRPLS